MNGHQTKAELLHVGPLLADAENLKECGVIIGFLENTDGAVAAIEHIVNNAADGRPGSAWHAAKDNTGVLLFPKPT